MHVSWNLLAESVAGTAHLRTGAACQDYAAVRIVEADGRWALVLACADGAGSAAYAEEGARLACTGFVTAAAAALDAGLSVSDMTPETVVAWYDHSRRRLSLEACLRGADIRDFACTLLTAVVENGRAVFSQLGDGAIVFRDGAGYQTAFWPQSGEYANSTHFLSDPRFGELVCVRIVERASDDVALLTDGLQSLALHYATRAVHAPFFDPMFAALRATPDPDSLRLPLRQFLTSEAVSNRTDDDKTLILATRLLPAHAATTVQ